jgi:YVTN family beta-propeller protein
VTVINGTTNDTATVTAGSIPYAVAVNLVTNKVYVVNRYGNSVTVIDGATNATATAATGAEPYAVVVNPVTNKVYVANRGGNSLTVIDGATNSLTTVAAGTTPSGVAVNPVTGRVYVANSGSDNVTVVTDVQANDTKVRAAYDPLPGDTTSHGRVVLNGRGVNRWEPSRTAMTGVLNRVGTAQLPWNRAYVTGGGGTDSISWTYNWGTDSLIPGENFVCCVPLEAQAAITNNLGRGTPFAGNLEVYPVYRVGFAASLEETMNGERRTMNVGPTIVRGVFILPASPRPRVSASPCLLDACGRKVLDLKPGANDVRALAPGVYFVCSVPSAVSRQPSAVAKVVVAR